MKQLRQVVMLPTEKASNLWKHKKEDRLGYSNGTTIEDSLVIPQHLYITSDEEIKGGDWYYNPAGNNFAPDMRLVKCESSHEAIACKNEPVCSKVIATTDKFLGEPQLPLSDAWRDWFKNRLPQIPESFIKAFVESNGTIKEVLVEYEECQTFKDDACGVRFGCCNSPIKLKTRPDNTIIISQSKTYTRDEVEILCNSAYANGMVAQQFIEDLPTPRVRFKQWIKDNL